MHEKIVRVMKPPSRPVPLRDWSQRIEARLEVGQLGFPLLAYETLPSTNDALKQMAAEGAPEGFAVLARTQTHGRGQGGRHWVSPPGKGVYLSILLRPQMPAESIKWLSAMAAMAARDALQSAGVTKLSLKWPNDVLADGRKIAGILVEPRMGQRVTHFAVVGMGINVLHEAEDWPSEVRGRATSCHLQGVSVTCDDVVVSVLAELDRLYARVKQSDIDFLREGWPEKDSSSPST